MADRDGHPDDPHGRGDGPVGWNMAMLQWFGMLTAASLLVAGQASMPLAIALLSALLLLFGASIGLVGLFAADRPSARHFTRWDVAAWLVALSVVAGHFADPAALASGVSLSLF